MEKQQSKKPLVRFPEFKDSWEHKRLNELLSEAKKRNEDLKYGKDKVLSVSGELGIVNQIEHLGRSYAGVSVHQYHVVEVGDIVYTKSPLKANPFGIIKLNKGKAGIVSTLYAVYKVNQQTANGHFIDYYFSLDANTNRYLRPLVRKGAKNTLQISNSEFISAEIFAPAIPEQKRIASFFTVLEKKITELKQKKNLLEQYKKGVMQKLFSQELRFKDENGKEFPKWEKKKLRDVVAFRNGKAHEQDISEDGKYIVVNSKFISMEGEVKKYSDTQICPLEVGEIVMVMSDVPNGKALAKCFYVDENDKYTLNQRICALKATAVEPKFLLYILNRNRYYLMFDSGVGQTNLTRDEVLNCPLEIPKEKNEQGKILNFISSIDVKIEVAKNQLEQTQRFKKGLLQNMFI
jgi:type I restriction enzyme S subunit